MWHLQSQIHHQFALEHYNYTCKLKTRGVHVVRQGEVWVFFFKLNVSSQYRAEDVRLNSQTGEEGQKSPFYCKCNTWSEELPCLTNVWLVSRRISQPSMIMRSIARFFLMFSVSLTSSCMILAKGTFQFSHLIIGTHEYECGGLFCLFFVS